MKKFALGLFTALSLVLQAPAFATVSSTVTRNEYVGTGSTASYSYTFLIFSATDLAVTKIDLSGVQTNLTYPIDYSVTGVGLNAGGSVTLTGGNLTTGYGLIIRRNRPLTQSTSIRNQGAFYPETIENTFDDLVIRSQQQQDQIGRAIQLPETMANASAFSTLIPLPVPANSSLATDPTGTHLVWTPAIGVGGAVPVGQGGTGQTSQASAFDGLAPTTTTGDLIYYGVGTNTRLPGPTTASKRFLSSTGTGTAAQAPAWGTISGSDLPLPSSSTLGGIESASAVSHQWINAISTSGVPSLTQPAFTDISGTVGASQLPSPSSTTLGGVESYAGVSHQWINSISTLGVPASSQPAFSDISGSVSAAQLPNPSSSTLGGIESAAAVSHQWISSISTLGVPALTQPAFTDISGTATVSQGGTGQTSFGAGILHSSGSALSSSLIVDADVSATAAIALSKLGQGGALTNQAVVWNGTAWAAGTVGGGALNATGSTGTPQNITAAGGIAFSGGASRSIWYVQGSGGAVTITANPQIAACTTTNQELVVVGTSDTNTVTLSDGTGLSMNGPMTLYNNSNIYFFCNGTVWSEISRRP